MSAPTQSYNGVSIEDGQQKRLISRQEDTFRHNAFSHGTNTHVSMADEKDKAGVCGGGAGLAMWHVAVMELESVGV